ncbi:MBL fold metallo-hydrolase [Microbacterium sp. NIBRBAC000506063]|uniref:MBL fold metallo-hydrolase n=1 Tax=Microbacterium sp. NIBRBAC000506063 TaxID=2734618 RepID=UPI001BB7E880|nr:MBL fold metallo-hydrolase [Microbacterium sp. NIBRBAC000506063]QTV79055.1 MBL fold metallo-hydrolase [Microbacterium sp. NIBRBAC000506063]
MSADVDPEEIRPGLWCLPMPIPYGPLSTTLGYAIVADDGVHLIDPGWESDANEARLARMLEQIPRSLNEVRTVVVTHHHPDHLGLADHVRRESGAHLVMSATEHAVLVRVAAPDLRDADGYQARLDGWGVPAERRDGLIESHADSIPSAPTRPDRTVHDGETLTLGDRALTVVETPGHTSGHICLVDTAAGVIFTGDHVLPEIYSGWDSACSPAVSRSLSSWHPSTAWHPMTTSRCCRATVAVSGVWASAAAESRRTTCAGCPKSPRSRLNWAMRPSGSTRAA